MALMGKYYDEWIVGEEYTTPGRTLTETDVVLFASMTGDYHELHTNEPFSAKSNFGRRIAHGLLGLSVSQGLFFRSRYLDDSVIAFLEIENWKFEAPIFFGDTVYVKIKVAEKRISKGKPDRGIVKFFLEIVNQGGTTVQSGYETYLISLR
jgi:acyl dehydratase